MKQERKKERKTGNKVCKHSCPFLSFGICHNKGKYVFSSVVAVAL
jgi:hypothetical protein